MAEKKEKENKPDEQEEEKTSSLFPERMYPRL